MQRLPAIDGLRAFAVLAVLVFHGFYGAYLPGGYAGVDLFFVISGYLITTILINEQKDTGAISLIGFYKRRARRILPALVAMVVIVFLVMVLLRLAGAPLHDPFILLILSLTSLMNWARALGFSGGGELGHTWSLAIEEQFYLIWPFLLIGLAALARNRAWIAAMVAVFFAMVLSWRSTLWFFGATPERLYNGLDTRADSLMAGALLALLGISRLPRILRSAMVPAGMLAAFFLCGPVWNGAFMLTVGYSLIALLSMWLVAALVAEPAGSTAHLFSSPIALWVGRRSYSLYLWHYPAIVIPGQLLPGQSTVTTAALLLASFLAADLSYRFIEQPFLRQKTLTLSSDGIAK
ncbi:acyltransferase family protein [Pseudorhizobium flavum]|uniref:acyltransferase family protein n=1 Tax=Pseudorhizobium flavum TaxID=1335061 RepID=UPI002492F2B4|nr:acyltransferase [Pseudorhizobium flavum]